MRRGKLIAVTVAGAVALAGCQSVNEAAVEAEPYTDERLDDPIVPIGPGGTLTVEGGDFFFNLQDGMLVDGPIEVTFINVSPQAVHNIRIDNAAGETKKVEAPPGETATGTLKLFAGSYTYYCDVPGHRSAGMEGELTVYPTKEEATPIAGETEGTETDEALPEDSGTADEAATEGASPAPTETDTSADA